MPLEPGDAVVSFLPLAHTFGCAFEFLFPFTLGCHITILTKTPSPQILIQAFGEIKPRLILSVPLVVEKIYKKQLLPIISQPKMKVMMAIPGLNKLIFKKINAKLTDTFGGRFRAVVVGGAAFNADAEKFFKKIGFRFTVGYGMTECGPLISYASWDSTKLGASGRAVDTLEVTIDSPDPQNIVGEIILRGENVMAGYYKNERPPAKLSTAGDGCIQATLGLLTRREIFLLRAEAKAWYWVPREKIFIPKKLNRL